MSASSMEGLLVVVWSVCAAAFVGFLGVFLKSEVAETWVKLGLGVSCAAWIAVGWASRARKKR